MKRAPKVRILLRRWDEDVRCVDIEVSYANREERYCDIYQPKGESPEVNWCGMRTQTMTTVEGMRSALLMAERVMRLMAHLRKWERLIPENWTGGRKPELVIDESGERIWLKSMKPLRPNFRAKPGPDR